MMFPRVGVTCNTALVTLQTGHSATVDTSLIQIGEVLSLCGMVPILIPLGVSTDVAGKYLKFLDGLVLSGGPDIGKVSGDQLKTLTGGVDSRKDLLEWQLCGLALSRGIPLLGICRGLQLINVYLGGTLYDDLDSEYPSAVPHMTQPGQPAVHHEIQLARESKMSTIHNRLELTVNSYHHQAIKQLAPGLHATAWAGDGIIEGVESGVYRSMIGVQFHPEMNYDQDETSMNLFRWLADAARNFLSLRQRGNCQAYP